MGVLLQVADAEDILELVPAKDAQPLAITGFLRK